MAETLEVEYQLDCYLPSSATLPRKRGAMSPQLPGVTRLMALAIKLDRMLREGVIQNYSQVARLGHVSRARVSQIMSLLQLAPDLQEQLLFLAATEQGRDIITEPLLRKVARHYCWDQQRGLFGQQIRISRPK
jgi:hypothetical protein